MNPITTMFVVLTDDLKAITVDTLKVGPEALVFRENTGKRSVSSEKLTGMFKVD